MQIGFSFDEFDRMIRFFNKSNPTEFSVPFRTRLYGKNIQKWKTYKWRKVTMPLIKAGLTKWEIYDWCNQNLKLNKDTLFEQSIEFPPISNCVGCFHKNPETIAAEAIINPKKIKWFAKQEKKSMGTWFDSKITYEEIMANAKDLSNGVLWELQELGQTCDSGGCTD